MNRRSGIAMMKHLRSVFALLLAGIFMAPATAAPNKGSDWLSLTAIFDAGTCTFTPTVTWVGFNGAKTLEVFVTQGYTGSKLVPSYVPVKGNSAVVTVTLAPLAVSATFSDFYPWAQLLDAHGVAIPASLDFASVARVYCTAP